MTWKNIRTVLGFLIGAVVGGGLAYLLEMDAWKVLGITLAIGFFVALCARYPFEMLLDS